MYVDSLLMLKKPSVSTVVSSVNLVMRFELYFPAQSEVSRVDSTGPSTQPLGLLVFSGVVWRVVLPILKFSQAKCPGSRDVFMLNWLNFFMSCCEMGMLNAILKSTLTLFSFMSRWVREQWIAKYIVSSVEQLGW